MKILLTGVAGFIGFHVARVLLERGDQVYGIDNLNDYYEVSLKEDRLEQLESFDDFIFEQIDIADRRELSDLFNDFEPERVVHLAAQAGVRYSIENPHAYMDSNISGTLNILEACRHYPVEHLVYASSSSVYGANKTMPFSVHHNVDHPVSLYAASKKSNELMAHTYSHLYGIPTTGLRFFTVYGPWGRPDMAYFSFTKKILDGGSINVFNEGKHQRDFTYIDDIVDGVVRTLDTIPKPNDDWNGDKPEPGTSQAPYRIYNIGNNNPVELMHFIETIEKNLGKEAQKNYLPMQPGDVEATYADVDDLVRDMGYKPNTPIEEGIEKFINWYKDYYGVEE